jgi:predicted outer membrane protein
LRGLEVNSNKKNISKKNSKMNTGKKAVSALLIVASGLMVSCNSSESESKMSNEDSMNKTSMNNQQNNSAMTDKDGAPDVSAWPERPRLAVKEMTAKYGAPTEVGSETIVWYNAGPYKRIMVTKKEIPHDFPAPHMDFLEHTISYNVPIDKIDDLVAYDASMTINKTQGEMSARCDLEGHNVLTLNLARDIINGTKNVEQARKAFGEAVVADFAGKHPSIVEQLQFTPPTEGVLFPDKPVIPGSAMRNVPNTEGTDAEVLAFVNAVNVNEILAAAEAQKKKISGPVMDYAKMLHTEHGANMGKTNALALSINVTPSITKAVDAEMRKGAGGLATLIPLDGKDFEAGYLDAMIKGHTEVLAMIDNQLMKTAKNDKLKAHLTETRGHVAMHLEQAKKLKG